MSSTSPTPNEDDYVAARVLLNLAMITRHDDLAAIATKTGMEPSRLTEIRTGHAYPDGYEIALIEHAYHQRIWPREHE